MQRKCVIGGIFIFQAIVCMMTISAHSAQAAVPNADFQVNINSRENVRNFYNTVYNASKQVAVDWVGDVSLCDAGDSSQQHKDATLRRINYFRAMAGVPAWIRFSRSANARARSAALLASANNALSHYPPSSWNCYSQAGSQASASSNIALGETGADAITAYIEDAGSHNLSVGHRRWMFYPQTRVMGTGDISPGAGPGQNASAINVFDNQYGQARPQTRNEYVSWPPAGFVPYQVVFPRWSFSLENADFSQASVFVTLNQQEIELDVFPVQDGFGENTLVWEMSDSDLPKPTTDLVYRVSIRNVLINGRYRRNYNYEVKVIDPSKPGADAFLPVINGDSQFKAGQSSQYTIAAIPGVTQYEVLRAQYTAYQSIATAESGLDQLIANTQNTTNVISDFTSNTGQKSYSLSHIRGKDQQLSFDQQFLLHEDSSLEFYSRINCAMPDETARVQVSLDDGSSWLDVYAQSGVRFGLRESDFSAHTINLGSFAGKIVRVRFNYTFKSGWRCSTANSGWYLDDIAFNHVDQLTNTQLTTISRAAFQFSPTQAGDYVFVVRGVLFNGFSGQWGANFPVQVTPEIRIPSVPPVQAPVQTPVENPPASSNGQYVVIFKSPDGSERRCEYTKARLDLNGDLNISLTDLSCFSNPQGN